MKDVIAGPIAGRGNPVRLANVLTELLRSLRSLAMTITFCSLPFKTYVLD